MARNVGETRNLFYIVDPCRTHGRTPRSWRTLKRHLSPQVQLKVHDGFSGIPPVLLELQDAVHARDTRRIKKVLVRVAQKLFEGNGHSATISTHNISTVPLMAFVAWGGLDVVTQLMFLDEPWLVDSPPAALQIWNLCIKLATEIVCSCHCACFCAYLRTYPVFTPESGPSRVHCVDCARFCRPFSPVSSYEQVMVDPSLSWYTFSREKCIVRRALKLLSFRVTFENAAVMCEQLLASIGPCVDLGRYPPRQ